MIVVADSSPLHYLILIGEVDLLRRLYSEVVVPDMVVGELTRPVSPPAVSNWFAHTPEWLRVLPLAAHEIAAVSESLDLGERAAARLRQTNFYVDDALLQSVFHHWLSTRSS